MAGGQHDNPLTATLSGLADLLRRRGRPGGVALSADDRLDGRTCLVTGANVGLGKGVAIGLARRGARVLMACRSGIPDAGEEVRRASGSDAVEMLPVDLSDLRSVHALCDALAERCERLDVTVLNAGVVPARARRTPQGLELMFAVNYLANVVLMDRLLADGVIPNQAFAQRNATPAQRQAPAPRVVLVSSESHRTAESPDLANLGAFVSYGPLGALAPYGQSKLLLSAFACELGRRLSCGDGRVDVAVHHLCPGAVNSRIAREAPAWLTPVLRAVMKHLFRSPEEAAVPVLYLACARAIEGQTGLYLHMEHAKAPGEHARDPAFGRRLWNATEGLLARVDPRRQEPGPSTTPIP
jgi:NAD(P)-dependent dehydrogenase (short-subunit alcohol dehydrogenase family)